MKKLKFIAILLILLNISCDKFNRTENLLYKVEELKNENDSLKKENLKLETTTDSIKLNKSSKKNYWFDNDYEASKFKEVKIENPEEYIEAQLRKRTELIPFKATLGGNMQFGKIQLLSKKWLIAEYNDGHIQGKAIYSYELKENREIEFKILESLKN